MESEANDEKIEMMMSLDDFALSLTSEPKGGTRSVRFILLISMFSIYF